MRYATAPLAACVVLTLITSHSPAAPATAPASRPTEWGEPKDGLVISAAIPGEIAVAGPVTLRCSLRNMSDQPVKLANAFGWILIVQSRDAAMYSEKIAIDAPAQVAAGATVEMQIDLGQRKVYALQKGQKVVGGYPTAEDATPAGSLSQTLPVGQVRARWVLCLPRGGNVTALNSAMIGLNVGPQEFKTMSPEAKQKAIAELIDRYKSDAFSAKAAHEKAMKMGPEVVPAIVAALGEPKVQEASRMWLATTLCDLGDPRGIDTLVKLLDAPDAGVRYVIAYHGIKLKNAKLTDAIVAKAGEGKDPTLAAWAARGTQIYGGGASEKLIDIALKSSEPRARAEVAEVLARRGGDKNVASLVGLLGDENELVRSAAARAVGGAKLKSKACLAAMVSALDRNGDQARESICNALCAVAGRQWKYDPEAPDAARQKTIADWKDWWKAEAGKYK